jgi:hypothetical protein
MGWAMSEIQEVWSLVIVFGVLATAASIAVVALLWAVFYLNDVIRGLRAEVDTLEELFAKEADQ